MRYLITGGAGFIGSHLVEHLVKEDQDVVVLDDFSTGKLPNLAPYMERVELIRGSVADRQVCSEAARGVDFVLHQAALPSVPRSVRDPDATHLACATGTLNLLLAAREAGVRRFVYAGSSSAYGNTPELPKREDMLPRPRSPYAVAKLAGEHYCQAFHATYGLETIILRYFNIFGPRQDPSSQYGAAIPTFITKALRNESPLIYGNGQQTRDFTFVENAVHANLSACFASKEVCGGVFNVGCGTRVSINELWAHIGRMTGTTAEPTYAPARPGDVRDSLASLDLSRQLLNYSPLVNLQDGLQTTVDHFVRSMRSSNESPARVLG